MAYGVKEASGRCQGAKAAIDVIFVVEADDVLTFPSVDDDYGTATHGSPTAKYNELVGDIVLNSGKKFFKITPKKDSCFLDETEGETGEIKQLVTGVLDNDSPYAKRWASSHAAKCKKYICILVTDNGATRQVLGNPTVGANFGMPKADGKSRSINFTIEWASIMTAPFYAASAAIDEDVNP